MLDRTARLTREALSLGYIATITVDRASMPGIAWLLADLADMDRAKPDITGGVELDVLLYISADITVLHPLPQWYPLSFGFHSGSVIQFIDLPHGQIILTSSPKRSLPFTGSTSIKVSQWSGSQTNVYLIIPSFLL
jgi:hypothetical protein